MWPFIFSGLQASLIGVEDMQSFNVLAPNYLSSLPGQHPAPPFFFFFLVAELNQEEGGAAPALNSTDIRAMKVAGRPIVQNRVCLGLTSGQPWDAPTDQLVHCSTVYHSSCDGRQLLWS